MTIAGAKFDYSRLRGRIREICGTQERFADEINLGRVSVSQRLNNSKEFSQIEMLRTAEVLHFTAAEIPLYFFSPEVQKHEQKASGQ